MKPKVAPSTRMFPVEAGKYLGRNAQTIMLWVRQGILSRRKDASGRIQVLRAEIEALKDKLPQRGRPAADLSAFPPEEGWMTIKELAQDYSDRGSYASWYGWARTGQLKVEGRPMATKKLWVLRLLESRDLLTEAEAAELQKLEVAHLKKVNPKGKRKTRK